MNWISVAKTVIIALKSNVSWNFIIEADPRAIRGETFKELGHWVDIDRTLTVKDIAMPGNHLWQFLDRLSLARSYRANWSSTILVVQCQIERLENFLSQRSNDKPWWVRQVLVAIGQLSVKHLRLDQGWVVFLLLNFHCLIRPSFLVHTELILYFHYLKLSWT